MKLTDEMKEHVVTLLKEVLDVGPAFNASEMKRPIEARVGLAACLGALTAKFKEVKQGPFSVVMEYLCDASDEEIMQIVNSHPRDET